MKVIAVSGGLGFIGQTLVDQLLAVGHRVLVIDAETYAADLSALERWDGPLHNGYLRYQRADVTTLSTLPDVDAIIHCAAETHVDNSLTDPQRFLTTNVLGTQRLLELVRAKRAYQMPLFLHVSTDEVYGSVAEGETGEDAPLRPTSPYAASKAAADLLVAGYGHTFGIPWRIVRPSNCYGPHQYPEKLIPKAVRHLCLERKIPIHEDGSAKRYWLAVGDCARAILTVLACGTNSEIYNVGGNTEAGIADIAAAVIHAFYGEGIDAEVHLERQYQRLGLDQRYHVNDAKLRTLGWSPRGNLWRDLPALVEAERQRFRW